MKVRNKKTGALGTSSTFNTHAIGEIIVCFDDGDCESEFVRDYEVLLESSQEWIDMQSAFIAGCLVTDNLNTCFYEKK